MCDIHPKDNSTNNSPVVSVIVPVYGVERYIKKCAESLFSQTLQNIEIIFIDDCSPDRSIEIIEETLGNYPDRTGNVRIIKRQSNTGLAGVRLQGIIEAKGDYIIHCDGDDWVDKDLYERMYEEALAKNADIVVCDEINENMNHQEIIQIHDMGNSCKDVIKNWYSDCVGMFCHNKLVKKDLYIANDVLPWVGLNMWEDNGLMTRLMYFGGKLSQIHDSYYHYNRANVSSMTASYGSNQINQMIGIASNLTDFFKAQPDAKEFEKTMMAFQFLAKIHYVMDSWSGLKSYKSTFPGSEKIAAELDPNAFSTKGKIRFYMVKHHLAWLFVVLAKIREFIIYK